MSHHLSGVMRDVLSEYHSSPPVTDITAAIEVETGTATFRVRCSSTGGRALNMAVSGPNGYISDISNNIQSVGSMGFLRNDNYTATTDLISTGNDGDIYHCNVTSIDSRASSATVKGTTSRIQFLK